MTYYSQKPELTLKAMRSFLAENGIKLRKNIITQEISIEGELDGEIDPSEKLNQFYIDIYDAIKEQGLYRCSRQLVSDYLGRLINGSDIRYNPVTDMLDKVDLDKNKDYLIELFSIMGIENSDTLSKILIHKWLLQCIALSRNTLQNAVGADGMLVLQGGQGVGKTSLIRKLGVDSKLCKLNCSLSEFDKDTKINALTTWIVEFGEFEKTVKGTSAETLKVLVTTEIDYYRVPYGKGTGAYPRLASLVGTCNHERFLSDDTGSRRYWVIPIDRIDLARLDRFDVLHMWKQIENEYEHNDQDCFRLTSEEQKALAIRNIQHERIDAEQEIADIIAEAELTKHKFGWITSTLFKTANKAISKYSAVTIGRALKKLNIEEKRTGKGRFYFLPLP